jgi:hypothetical protein
MNNLRGFSPRQALFRGKVKKSHEAGMFIVMGQH